MSSDEEETLLPSSIVKQNKLDKERLKREDELCQKRLKASEEYTYKFKQLIDEQKTIANTIFHIDEQNPSVEDYCIEDLDNEALKNIFPDYNEHNFYPIKQITSYDCKVIHDCLKNIFNKYINELYHSLSDKNILWSNNIRKFIEFHDASYLNREITELNEQEIDEIKKQGFEFFVGENCANIDEDEFDGPNDLSIEEWELLDDIILCYYHKYYTLDN